MCGCECNTGVYNESVANREALLIFCCLHGNLVQRPVLGSVDRSRILEGFFYPAAPDTCIIVSFNFQQSWQFHRLNCDTGQAVQSVTTSLQFFHLFRIASGILNLEHQLILPEYVSGNTSSLTAHLAPVMSLLLKYITCT